MSSSILFPTNEYAVSSKVKIIVYAELRGNTKINHASIHTYLRSINSHCHKRFTCSATFRKLEPIKVYKHVH